MDTHDIELKAIEISDDLLEAAAENETMSCSTMGQSSCD